MNLGKRLAKLLANCFVEIVVRQVEYFELGEFVETVRQTLELVHAQIEIAQLLQLKQAVLGF